MQLAQKVVEHTVPKKELFIVSIYLGLSSFCVRTLLKKVPTITFHFVKSKLFLNHLTFLGSSI